MWWKYYYYLCAFINYICSIQTERERWTRGRPGARTKWGETALGNGERFTITKDEIIIVLRLEYFGDGRRTYLACIYIQSLFYLFRKCSGKNTQREKKSANTHCALGNQTRNFTLKDAIRLIRSCDAVRGCDPKKPCCFLPCSAGRSIIY